MEYTIRFRLDVKNNIYVSKKAANTEPYYQISAIIRINRCKEIHYFTGYSAQKTAWFGNRDDANRGDGNRSVGIHKNCTAKQRTRIVMYSEVNQTLDLICATLLTLSNKAEDMAKEELVEALNKAIGKAEVVTKSEKTEAKEIAAEPNNTFWTLADLFCKDTMVSPGRCKSRINAMNHLRCFEAVHKMKITFAECNAKLLTEFQHYLTQDEGQFNKGRSSVCSARKKNRNTVSKIMTVTKHFFRWCRRRYGVTEYGNIADYQVPTAMYGDPITLNQDEKRQLFNTELDDAELEYTRDLFYFQCSIGARVSDFFKLKYENLRDEDGVKSIHYLPKKTQDVTAITCRIPLSPVAIQIVEKYKPTEATPKTPLFNFPRYVQTYNDNLKKIFKAAKLDRIVTTCNAHGETEFKPLYELAKSKFARSCFIDILVGQGVPDNIITTMSGHTAGSKAFHRYHNSMKEEQQNKAVMLLD